MTDKEILNAKVEKNILSNDIDPYFNDLVKKIESKKYKDKINISDSYWEQVDVREKNRKKKYYRYYELYKIPYETYSDSLKLIWENIVKKVPGSLKDTTATIMDFITTESKVE